MTKENPEPVPVRVRVLAGVSPIRQILLARAEFPEQDLRNWEQMPLQRIRIGDEPRPPILETSPELDSTTRERIFQHLGEALRDASGSETEQHPTPFGCIVVAKIAEPKYLAFAVEAKWPFNILEVHRLNRNSGETEAIKARDGLRRRRVAASDGYVQNQAIGLELRISVPALPGGAVLSRTC